MTWIGIRAKKKIGPPSLVTAQVCTQLGESSSGCLWLINTDCTDTRAVRFMWIQQDKSQNISVDLGVNMVHWKPNTENSWVSGVFLPFSLLVVATYKDLFNDTQGVHAGKHEVGAFLGCKWGLQTLGGTSIPIFDCATYEFYSFVVGTKKKPWSYPETSLKERCKTCTRCNIACQKLWKQFLRSFIYTRNSQKETED